MQPQRDAHATGAENLAELIRERSGATPRRTFVRTTGCGERAALTYGGLAEAGRRLAKAALDAGCAPGSRVCVLEHSALVVLQMLAACAEASLTLVPINPNLHRSELAAFIAHSDPSLVVALDERLTLVREIMASINRASAPIWRASDLDAIRDSDIDSEIPRAAQPDEPLLHVYTSGTMDGAKAVILTHRNLLANARAIASRLSIGVSDRLFGVLPIHHTEALVLTAIVPLVAGAEVLVADMPSEDRAKAPSRILRSKARDFWETVVAERVTIASALPSFLAMLLELHGTAGSRPHHSLRAVLCGTAPLPSDQWQRFETTFGCPVHQGYGLVETTCWAACTNETGQYASVGKPLDCEIKIHLRRVKDEDVFVERRSVSRRPPDMEDRRKNAGSSSIGEILVRGPLVSAGYYRDLRSWKSRLTDDGFLKTGDLGFIDGEGRLHVIGRLKELIVRNGFQVLASDIDEALGAHPAVQESKTVSIPDATKGERVCTACVLTGTASPIDRRTLPPPAATPPATPTADELLAWMRGCLSDYKWPDEITLMGYLPRSASGKVSVDTLRRILTGALADEIIDSLSRKRDKRAPPSDVERTRRIVQSSLVSGAPIRFLMYWGCGMRDHAASVDRATLERLRAYVDGAARIPQAPAAVTLIMTDVHGRLNGKPEARWSAYFADVERIAHDLGMETVRASSLWERAGLSLEAAAAEASTRSLTERWDELPIRDQLVAQARKHVEGSTEYEERAKLYFAACTLEAHLYERLYPDYLFVTYNAPALNPLFPEMPTFYIYSWREGTTAKPWFTSSSDAGDPRPR